MTAPESEPAPEATRSVVGKTPSSQKVPARFWPFSARTGVLLVPLLFGLLLLGWGLGRGPLHMDTAPVGWVLLGIVLLSLLPVLLSALDGLAMSGGSIEVGKVKVALTAAATAQRLVVAPPNVAPGTNIGDSGSQQIIDGLKRAQSAKIVVVRLEDGHAWWESRLLILCEGAVRLGHPEVMVFTASRRDKPDQFVGWGHSAQVRGCIVQANPDYGTAYDKAVGLAAAARHQHALDGAAPPALQNKQYIVYPGVPGVLNPFLDEQLLADALAPLEASPREIGAGRLQDLLDPVLHTGAVDRTDLDAEWFKKALQSDEEYVAVTDSGTYVALMTRADVVSEVLLAVTET
jgi:hypothetical protein